MIEQEIITLLGLRDNIHLEHWATLSYAQHKALNSFYDNLLDLIDTLVETYQGKYGRLELSGAVILKREENIPDKVYSIVDIIETKIDKKDTDILNILADFKGLCNKTKYLLTLK